MFKVLVGVLSFAVIVFFASQSFAHADDSDFALHLEVYEPSVTIIGLPATVNDGGFQIEYHRGQEECVLRLDSRYTAKLDTLTVRVSNARPVYRFDGVILGCHDMFHNKFRNWTLNRTPWINSPVPF